jgi:5'-nucleotidase (lipoprotein e(P4) family)
MATLYSQRSAEAEALYYQAYNMARIMVHNELTLENIVRKRAIITDIDETVLDNSPYQAMCIKEGINYPERWDEWCRLASAKALPGSQQFLNYVAAQDIEIFYITNRKEHLREATIQNLKMRAFPYADNEHLIMRTSINSKENRRKPIEDEYRVILLLGDNLDDFTNAFEERGGEKRKEMVRTLRSSFGRRFILFPNPMYGSWESALYEYKNDLSPELRSRARMDALEGF